MEIAHPALQFSANARILIQFRTGEVANELKKDAIMHEIGSSGYFVHRGGNLAIVLIDQDHDALTKKKPVEKMIEHVFAKNIGALQEVIVAVIVHSSYWVPGRLSAMYEQLAIVRKQHPQLFIRLDVSGGLAFNALARAAFPARKQFIDRGWKGVRPMPALQTDKLSDHDRANYARFMELSQIPPLEENDVLCVWNGYRMGDVVWVENLSQNTIRARGIYRVIAPSVTKQKTQADTADEPDS